MMYEVNSCNAAHSWNFLPGPSPYSQLQAPSGGCFLLNHCSPEAGPEEQLRPVRSHSHPAPPPVLCTFRIPRWRLGAYMPFPAPPWPAHQTLAPTWWTWTVAVNLVTEIVSDMSLVLSARIKPPELRVSGPGPLWKHADEGLCVRAVGWSVRHVPAAAAAPAWFTVALSAKRHTGTKEAGFPFLFCVAVETAGPGSHNLFSTVALETPVPMQ